MPGVSCEIIETAGKGRGIVARRPFIAGKLVMRITGQVIEDRSYSSRYCIDLGEGRSLEPDPPGAFLNHSCDPNCELLNADDDDGRIELRATRDVAAGEELTIDYAWVAEDEPYPCACGSEGCRQYIVDAAELPKLLAALRRRGAVAGKKWRR